MNPKIKIPANTKWESLIGYSRAVRVGNVVRVSGTAAVDENSNVIGINDVYAQTEFIIKKIGKALHDSGASLSDVVKNIIYTTDISKWDEIGRAHNEFFKDIKPALTLVEIKSFLNPDILVEIESEAIITND